MITLVYWADLPKWDRRFLRMANEVATWSKDPRGGVGAIIARDKNFVSPGFNGFPPGIDDSRMELYGKGVVIHAEENAMLFARRDLSGCTMYTTPLPPCPRCASKLIVVGIKRVVFRYVPVELAEEKVREFELSFKNLQEAGLAILAYKGNIL